MKTFFKFIVICLSVTSCDSWKTADNLVLQSTPVDQRILNLPGKELPAAATSGANSPKLELPDGRLVTIKNKATLFLFSNNKLKP